MEGTPFLAENNSDKEKERRRKEEAEQEERRAVKKPEAIGFLAVEPASEKEPKLSPLEKAIAATRTPDPEAVKKKPDAEEEPVVILPETEPPSDRVAEEDARRIVHEMVRAEQRADAQAAEVREAETAEDEPEPVEPVEAVEAARDTADDEPPAEAIEPAPEPRVEAETAVPEAPGSETDEAAAEEAAAEEDTADTEPAAEHIDAEPAPEPEAAVVSPGAEVVQEERVEAEAPQPAEASAEKPDDDEEDKPGRIRSFFSRGRDKAEQEAESGKEDEEPAHEQAPAVEIAEAAAAVVAAEAAEAELEAAKAKAKKKSAGPEFRFKEETEEEDPDESEAPAAKAAEATGTRRKPEAKPERIGQMLLNTEAATEERRSRPVSEAAESSKTAEEKMRVESSPIEPVSGKRVDTLSRAELMKLGEKIEINGSNLRHVYETHLIGERGLRRLVAEYLRGGDLGRALRREVVEHEMDFERDPVMRDLAPTSVSPIDGNNAALEKLLKQADVSLEDNGESTALFKAQARHQAASHERSFQMRRLLDIGLTLVITTLIVLIIIIYLVRG